MRDVWMLVHVNDYSGVATISPIQHGKNNNRRRKRQDFSLPLLSGSKNSVRLQEGRIVEFVGDGRQANRELQSSDQRQRRD